MADIFMRFPGGKAKALTLSYDDGVEQDQKLIKIMDRYGLKGTFNLNSGLYAAEGTVYPAGTIHRRMTKEQVTKLYGQSGHEVAVHGLTHPWLEKLPPHMAARDLIADRENLENQFHTIVRGMAYPFGTFNDAVVNCVKTAGLVYARTVISSHSFGIPADWLRLEATCHHKDPELMALAERFTEEDGHREPWLFYLWGHSYEFEADDNWDVIERFGACTGRRDNIWYATNIAVYDYVKAFERLEFSADGKRVFNPSAQTVWFRKDGMDYRIDPGMGKELECREFMKS